MSSLSVTLRPRYAFGLALNQTLNTSAVTIAPPSAEFVLSIAPFFAGSVVPSFETVSKNLKAYPYTAQRDGQGNITSLTYTTPSGDVVKTLNRTGGLITSIVLSGPGVPAGVSLTKTLSYTEGVWSGASYS
jgi:hypothetical protein